MPSIRGFVQEVKELSTAYGPMFNVIVNGESFGAGKFKPRVNQGDAVEFEFEQKGRFKNITPKSIRAVDPSTIQATSPTVSRAAPAAAASRAADFTKNQDTISKQAARNTAVAFMNILAGQDALPVAKTAKAGDKFDALRGILDKLTEEFYNYSIGKDSTPLTSAAEAASPEDEDGPWNS